MTIKETFVCPVCGCATKTAITGVNALTDDVRYDMLTCGECGAQWRVYFKETDISTEVMFIPQRDEGALEDVNPIPEIPDAEMLDKGPCADD